MECWFGACAADRAWILNDLLRRYIPFPGRRKDRPISGNASRNARGDVQGTPST